MNKTWHSHIRQFHDFDRDKHGPEYILHCQRARRRHYAENRASCRMHSPGPLPNFTWKNGRHPGRGFDWELYFDREGE